MKKNKFLSIIAMLLLATMGLTSCGNTDKEDNTTKPTETTVKEKQVDKETEKTENETAKNEETKNGEKNDTVKKEIPKVYIAFATDKMKKAYQDRPYNEFISDDNVLAQQAKDFFDKNSGKEINIYSRQTKQNYKEKIRKYTPIHFLDVSEKSFDYEDIKKENPDLIQVVKDKDGKEFFFMTLPLLGKEYIYLDDSDVKKVKENIHRISDKYTEGKPDVIIISDVANPKTAADVLSDSFDKMVKEKENINMIFLPLVTKTNRNALYLTRFLILNKKDNGQLNIDLLKAMMKKQRDLLQLDIEDGSNIKEILKLTDYKDVDKLKTRKDLKEAKDLLDLSNINYITQKLIMTFDIGDAIELDGNKLGIIIK